VFGSRRYKAPYRFEQAAAPDESNDFAQPDELYSSFQTITPVAKHKSSSRIPKPRQLRRPRLRRGDVTRGEYTRVIEILNERNVILNALRKVVNELRRELEIEAKRNDRFESAVEQLKRDSEVQFKRIAQMQAELDIVRRAADKVMLT
jgi:hypothetical protein